VESGPAGGRLRDVEEGDEALGYDLSSYGGVPMKRLEAQSRTADSKDGNERDRDLNEASHAAEFELGAGMNSILHKPFVYIPPGPTPGEFPGHRRILSSSEIADAQAKKAQKEAEKTGQVVAVAADTPFDISDFAGVARDFDSMSTLIAEAGLVKDEAQTSYFFPPGGHGSTWTMNYYANMSPRSSDASLEAPHHEPLVDTYARYYCTYTCGYTGIHLSGVNGSGQKRS
jgi:hypothetical protein